MPGHDLIVPQGGVVVIDNGRDELDAVVDAFAASAKSAATRKAYRADARDFFTWCSGQGVNSVPAEPRTVARYITSLVGRGLSVSTIDCRVAAVTAAHAARVSDLAPTIAELRAEGAPSLKALAASLNARGIPTARSGEWSAV